MKESACHFWRNGSLETFDRTIYTKDFYQSSMFKYLYCQCAQVTEEGKTYFGSFNSIDEGKGMSVFWNRRNIENFDPEFRAHLLLLGVSKP